MSTSRSSKPAYEIIKQEKEAYLEEFPDPDPDWPPDVRVVYETLRRRLFEPGLEAQAIVEECGIGDHNIYIRFDYFIGYGIKELVLHHRLILAKRLLKQSQVPIGKIALAVGYGNPSGFSATFKRREQCSPSAFREREG